MLIHKQTYITRAHNAGGIVRPLRAPEKTRKNRLKNWKPHLKKGPELLSYDPSTAPPRGQINPEKGRIEQAPRGGRH